MRWLCSVCFLGSLAFGFAASAEAQEHILQDPQFRDILDNISKGKNVQSNLTRFDRLSQKYGADPKSSPNIQALITLADSLIKIGQPDKALPYSRRARTLAPENIHAFTIYGWTFFNQRKYDQAEKVYRESMELHTYSPQPYYNLGHALGAQKRLKESIEFFEKAVEIAPEISLFTFSLAEALDHTQKPEEALKLFDRVITLTQSQSDPGERWNRHRALWHKGKLLAQRATRLSRQPGKEGQAAQAKKGAEDCFKEALKTYPKDADAKVEYAKFLIRERRIDDAIRVLNDAVKVNARHRWAWSQLSIALRRNGDADGSRKAKERFSTLQKELEQLEFEDLLTKIKGPAYLARHPK